MSIAESLRNLSYPANVEEIKLVSEVAYNVLYGTVLLTTEEVRYFKSQKSAIRILANQSTFNAKTKALSPNLFEKLAKAALRHLDG